MDGALSHALIDLLSSLPTENRKKSSADVLLMAIFAPQIEVFVFSFVVANSASGCLQNGDRSRWRPDHTAVLFISGQFL
jgi:hypothetical protein